MDPELGFFGGGAFPKENRAGELLYTHALLKLSECCVECSIHFLSNFCGISLE